MPAEVDDEQAGGEAGDDLVAQPLGRLGARLHRALLRPQVAQRVLHRRGHEHRLAAAARRALVMLRGGDDEAEDRVRENRGERRDDGGEPEEEVAGLVHRAGHDTTADGAEAVAGAFGSVSSVSNLHTRATPVLVQQL